MYGSSYDIGMTSEKLKGFEIQLSQQMFGSRWVGLGEIVGEVLFMSSRMATKAVLKPF